MASPAIEALRAERASQRAAGGYKPLGYTPPNTNQRLFGVEITPDSEEKNFGQKVLQDTALLAYGVPTALAKIGTGIFTDPIGTAKFLGGAVKQTATDIVGVTGFLGEEQQKESVDYYKAHPVFGLLDAFGVASLGTGAVLKSALTGTARSAIESAIRIGVKEGVEETAIRAAMQTTRSALNPKRVVGMSETRVSTSFMGAITAAVRTGKVSGVVTVVRDSLIKGGVAEGAALRIAEDTAKSVAESVVKQSSRLKTLDAITHPVGAAFRADRPLAGVIAGKAFGTQEQTAVGVLFGSDVVNANKKSAIGLERWLEANVLERGFENTMESRLRMLLEWKKQSDFANLTTEQLFRDFDNYVQHDVKLRQLRELSGESFVGVKALSRETAESMATTAKENIDRIVEEVGQIAGATPEGKVSMIFDKLSEFLEQNFGRDFVKYAPRLREAFGAGGSVENLERAILALSSTKPSLSFAGWSPEAQAIVKDLEGFGYQIGRAPEGKKISFAADTLKESGEVSGFELGVTSFRGRTVSTIEETRPYYNSSRAKGFEKSLTELGEQNNVSVQSVERTGGVWEGNLEPSFLVKVKGNINDVIAYLGKTQENMRGKQDAFVAFKAGEGSGVKYVFEGVEDTNLAIRETTKAGIKGATALDKKGLIVYDVDGSLASQIKKLSKALSINPTKTYGTVRFIEKAEYESAAATRGRGVGSLGETAAGRGQAVSEITESLFDTQRNYLGKVLDNFGFSTRGVVEGTNEFVFRQSWIQNALTEIGAKFGGVIKINKPVSVKTTTGVTKGVQKLSIPVEKLYEWLRTNRSEIFANRVGVGTFKAYRPISVFDITADDLVRYGFDAKVADAIQDVSRSSLRSIPTSVIGVGEKLVNLLRTADVGFAKFGAFYDTFLKTAFYMRYQSGLSVMFQAQQFIETKMMSAMLTKDARMLPGAQGLAGFGERMIPSKVGGILGRAKTYLQKMNKEPELNELVIARDELLPNVRRALEDTMGTPEFAGIRSGVGVAKKVETGADVLSRSKVEAFWMQMMGGWSQGIAAKVGKAISEKFGMSLEEATAFTMKDGNKVYNHPQLVRTMQDAVQQTLHYKVGFQTSPLAKTLNIVFFPFRFQAKTVEVTAKWLGTISPTSRAVVINNWVHFANWAGTDEGIEWRKTHKNLLYSILAYTTAWEQMGDSVNSVARGRLFGGATGLIGGVPFGAIYNAAQELAIIPDDPEQVDPATGRLFRFKEVPRELVSDAAFLVALEEFVFMMIPGLPLYTVTGGVIKASYRKVVEDAIESGWGWSRATLQGEDPKRGKQMLERDFMRVKYGDTRF